MKEESRQAEGLTVCGAASGAVAGAVAHLDALPSHFQQTRFRDASLASVAEALLVVAAVVGDVDGRPGGPGRGLLQVGAGQAVARLVLLQHGRNKLRLSISKFHHCLKKNIFPEDRNDEKNFNLFLEEMASVFKAAIKCLSADSALLLPPKCRPDEAPHPECLSSHTHRLRVYS